MSRARGVGIGLLAVTGALIVLSGLKSGRGPLGELVMLVAVAAVVYFAGRVLWRWWRAQPLAFASAALVVALAVAAAGWLLVAIVHALSHVSSENYGMIIVWPLVFLAGIVAVCGGVLAAAAGVAAVITTRTGPAKRRALVVIGGVAAVALNLWHAVALTRLIFTG